MSVETAFRQHLIDDIEVNSYVGSRIYHNRAPQSATVPYVVLSRVGGYPIAHLLSTNGIAGARFQVDVWDTDPIRVEQVTEAIRMSFPNHGRSDLGSGSNQVACRRVIPVGGIISDVADVPHGTETMHHRRIQDWEVVYVQDIPA